MLKSGIMGSSYCNSFNFWDSHPLFLPPLSLVLLCAMVLPLGTVDGGLLGLSLTHIMAVSAVLQYIVRQSTELESIMTSVERALEYTGELKR